VALANTLAIKFRAIKFIPGERSRFTGKIDRMVFASGSTYNMGTFLLGEKMCPSFTWAHRKI